MQVIFIIFSNLFCFILKHTEKYIDEFLGFVLVDWFSFLKLWLSPRFISIGQLNVLLHLHLQPIST